LKQQITVHEGAAGERLDVFLAKALGRSRSQAQQLLQQGAVNVNGGSERPSYLVERGDRVLVQPAEAPPIVVAIPELPIVYEDADIVVVDKPSGIAAHAGSGTTGEATVADFARAHTTDTDPERPGIVHRLDRETSGLMVLAKTAAAKEHMQAQFRDHRVHKTYQLLAVGRVEPPEAVIKLPLDRNPAKPLTRTVIASGRPAVTRYRTLASFPGYTFIQANPETGRTHQIRVHFSAIGHPIAGDTLYGAPKRPLGLTRQFLHAAALEFVAPSGQTVKLHSQLPPELAKIIAQLEEQV
jgi:23S rRNA pseudouridine1911/1915/1917 synthase